MLIMERLFDSFKDASAFARSLAQNQGVSTSIRTRDGKYVVLDSKGVDDERDRKQKERDADWEQRRYHSPVPTFDQNGRPRDRQTNLDEPRSINQEHLSISNPSDFCPGGAEVCFMCRGRRYLPDQFRHCSTCQGRGFIPR